MHIYRGYDTNDDTDADAHMRERFLSVTQTGKKNKTKRGGWKSPFKPVALTESQNLTVQ